MEQTICACCDKHLEFRWADTHGVGVCCTCALPYQIMGYNEKKENTPAIKAEWLPLHRRYYQETGGKVSPGSFDMGFLGGRSTTYSGATQKDVDKWTEWMDAHEAEWPNPPEVATV